MKAKTRSLSLLIVTSALVVTNANADDARLRETLRTLTLRLRSAETERNTLLSDKAQLEQEKKALSGKVDGLEPAVIDLVRLRKPVTGLAEKDAALIELGREVFGKHFVSADTYARALKAFGERDLVDLVDLMGQHAADEVLLIAFDQQLIPLGQKRLLPIP